jgi:excisionase family DNA binding protein
MRPADMPNLDELPPMLTADEVAPFYRVSPPTVRKWVRDKAIEGGVVVGGKVLVRKSALQRWLDGN